jgi:hypothetical protein
VEKLSTGGTRRNDGEGEHQKSRRNEKTPAQNNAVHTTPPDSRQNFNLCALEQNPDMSERPKV